MKEIMIIFLMFLWQCWNCKLNGGEGHMKPFLSARKQGGGKGGKMFGPPTKVTSGLVPVPTREQFEDECDLIIKHCMLAYQTGEVCGRTLLFKYNTFKYYCVIDWLNCRLRYEVWQFVYVGPCFPEHKQIYETPLHDLFAMTGDPWLDEVYAHVE